MKYCSISQPMVNQNKVLREATVCFFVFLLLSRLKKTISLLVTVNKKEMLNVPATGESPAHCVSLTFFSSWVDTVLEAPVLAAAGHLDDVKLTNTRFTLRENKRKIIQNYFQHWETVFRLWATFCCSHRVNVLHVDKDQRSTAALFFSAVMWRNTAARGRRLNAQRATGTNKHCVS